MSQEDFRRKVEQWLEKEGNARIGIWTLHESGENATVSVNLTIDSIQIIGNCPTEKCDAKIETAVLALNEGLLKKMQ